MTNTDDILLAIQEAVRKALNEAANAEIEKQKHKFECEMGKGRAKDFCLAYMKAANEMSQLMHDDQRDDPDFEYAKAKIDQRIRAIIGDEIFVPWEVRYGQKEYREE